MRSSNLLLVIILQCCALKLPLLFVDSFKQISLKALVLLFLLYLKTVPDT